MMMKLLTLVLLLTIVSSTSLKQDLTDPWEPIRTQISKFPLKDFCVSVGNKDKQLFVTCKGNMSMTKQIYMASSSKFPTAAAIMGVVKDPSTKLSLDSLASDILPYWTTDPNDRRSQVTLRNLLSFTSGFYASGPAGGTPCMAFNSTVPFDTCIQEIYTQGTFAFKPGTTWDYNSYHLQIAGGMASAAAKKPIIDVLKQNLLIPYNMTQSSYMNPENPSLAAGLVTTGADYEKFLRAYLDYKIVPKPLANQMEQDVIVNGVRPSNSSGYLLEILGHYGMAHYFQCIPPKKSEFTQECLEADVHADPGLFGYWPLVDRKNQYYLQIVQQKIVKSGYNLIPTILASILLDLIKPKIDAIVKNTTMPSRFRSYSEAVDGFLNSHPSIDRDILDHLVQLKTTH